MISNDLIVVIPSAGFGKRFSSLDSRNVKPFIKVLGKTQIEWVLESVFKSFNPSKVIIGTRTALIPSFNKFLRNYPNHKVIDIVDVGEITLGAANTVYKVLESLSPKDRDLKLLCVDNDAIFSLNFGPILDGDILIGFTNSANKEHSFINRLNYRVIEIEEKKMISNLACSGQYLFKSSSFYISLYNRMIDRNQTNQANEIYISNLIKLNLKRCLVLSEKCDRYYSIGTPAEINSFIMNKD